MSDLDRAVDARVEAYTPHSAPPFAAVAARKRSRERRNLALAGGLLSAAAVATAVLVPPLLTDDTLVDPGTLAYGGARSVSRTTFQLEYEELGASERSPLAPDPALRQCLDLPGARDQGLPAPHAPSTWRLTAEGTPTQLHDVRSCLQALDSVTVSEVPEVNVTPPVQLTFRVSATGPADAAAYTEGVEACLRLPGVIGSSVQESYPAVYEIRAGEDAAGALQECLAAVPSATVVQSAHNPAGN